jgi:ABC-type phosphate/phosphonate transport system substrate-binding protein
VAKAPRVPFDAYVLREGLGPEVGHGLGALLGELSTQTAEGRRVLRGTPSVNGFFPVTDAHYDILRQVERTVEDRLSAG